MLRKELPLVSIITVTYNAEKYLEKTIQNVRDQTYKNIEYIIIDGGSNDSTIKIIEDYSDIVHKWVSESDNGIYDAINKGINLSTGILVGIINADDWYELDAVETIVEAYINHSDQDIFHANLIRRKEDGCYLKMAKPNIKYHKIWHDMILHHPTCFIKKDAYLKWGLYDIHYRIAGDYELLLRYYLQGAKFYYINKILTNMRVGGISDVNTKQSWLECKDIVIKYNMPKYIALFDLYKKVMKKWLRHWIKTYKRRKK